MNKERSRGISVSPLLFEALIMRFSWTDIRLQTAGCSDMHREIAGGVYFVGVDDHRTQLFENLWALPHGVSYNSYLIVDDKIALVDAVKESWADEWLENIREIVDPSRIDYIILNHMELDHTGALPHIARIARNATLIYTPRASPMQKAFFDVSLKEKTVKDLDEISLGNKTLKFVHAQFLHWPETMMTYVVEDQVLFSCDAFGSYGALNGKIFDDESDMQKIEKESKRYLSSIITSYLMFVRRGVEKVRKLGIAIKIVAPSHGPVYRNDPMWIISRYYEWSSPQFEKHVAIVYGTMYGYTHSLAVTLKDELVAKGIEVRMHDVSQSEMSNIVTDTIRASVIALGTPTYDAYPFPRMQAFVNEMEGKRFPRRPLALFGTFGWGGGGIEKLQKQLANMGFEILEPVTRVHARPSQQQKHDLVRLTDAIARKISQD